MQNLLLALPALPIAVSIAIVLGRLDARRSARAAVGAGAVGAAVAALVVAGVARDGRWSMVAENRDGEALLGLTAGLTEALLGLLVALVGVVVQSFAARSLDGDPGQRRFVVLAGLLTGATTLVALSATAVGVLAGWVATSAALVALVGHHRPWRAAADAARRTRWAFVVSDVALALAVGLVLAVVGDADLRDLGAVAEALRTEQLLGIGAGRWLDIVAVLLVTSGIARSALVPLHGWLPATIAAPTPVSALLHAGVVNGIGVLVLRFAPVVGASTVAMALAFVAGAVTAVAATTVMLTRVDTKGGLAWSTAGQMGFMTVQLAVGAHAAALLHLLGHAMYKAALFLGAGGAIAGHRRSRHLPVATTPLPRAPRLLLATAVPALSVGASMAVIRPHLTAAGATLVVVFAWLTAAQLTNGWLRSVGASSWGIAAGTGLGALAPAVYVAGVHAFESFVASAVLDRVPAAVGAGWLWGSLAVVAVGVALLRFGPDRWQARVLTRAVSAGIAVRRVEPVAIDRPVRAAEPLGDAGRSVLRADVATAGALVPPAWPLTTFVAVNPLGGLEDMDFEDACAEARRWFGASTHLPLDRYRSMHREGEITDGDLRAAIAAWDPGIAMRPSLQIGDDEIDIVDLVRRDVVEGPLASGDGSERPVDPIADYVARWCAAFIDHDHAPLGMPARERGFYRSWHRLVADDRWLRRLLGRDGHAWIVALPDDATAALGTALHRLGVADDDRVDALRGLVTRLPGWAGLARWADDWAGLDAEGPRLRLLDLVAVLAVLDAAVGDHHLVDATAEIEELQAETAVLEWRVAAAVDSCGGTPTDEQRAAVAAVLHAVPESARAAIWLGAHEAAIRDRLLGQLQRVDPGPTIATPTAQLVACIDVRSEVLRRHLEQVGEYETFGFAGFFGVPLRWQPVGSTAADARCPVLVRPQHTATEVPVDGGWRSALPGPRAAAGGRAAGHDAKRSLGSPFALAEAAGWLLGPAAGVRTLAPSLSRRAGDAWISLAAPPATRPVVDLPLEDQVLFAEAILTTIGMRRFAPLVVLCGHGSRTTNNPHASSLDCGACGGAPGGASARAVAAILDDPDVRTALAGRGIEIGADTWFLAAEHDTTADRVTILDRHLVPAGHRDALARLETDLEAAGQRSAAERATRLPGDPARVRVRGRDWAEVRPEWGLAGNIGMVIGPRSMTRDLDLEGRTFLHSYDSAIDPDGSALETILTAPLVVAEWISMQYYFSTVDQEVFGAGDKMVHNPVGGIGVLRGDGGDLAIGLPLQSVARGDRLAHEPVRLLAAVQAPLEHIESIIRRNPGLRDLVENRWITIAGRSHGHEPWSVRTSGGTWQTWHPAADDELVKERS